MSAATKVSLPLRDRRILERFISTGNTKTIANDLEIATSTVNTRLSAMCEKTGVDNRYQLFVWFLQNPRAILKGVQSDRGLHAPGCPCNSPYCAAMRPVSTNLPAAA